MPVNLFKQSKEIMARAYASGHLSNFDKVWCHEQHSKPNKIPLGVALHNLHNLSDFIFLPLSSFSFGNKKVNHYNTQLTAGWGKVKVILY